MAKGKARPKKLPFKITIRSRGEILAYTQGYDQGFHDGIFLASGKSTNSAVAAVRLRGTSQRKKRKEGN